MDSIRSRPGPRGREAPPPTSEHSTLVGNLARNPQRVRDLDGEVVDHFIFDDMSVREGGVFTLHFRLVEACVPFSSIFEVASSIDD